MKRNGYLLIAILMLLSLSACSSLKDAGSTAGTAPLTGANTRSLFTQSSQSGSYFTINEIGLGPEGFVALTNYTDVPASLRGFYLCQGSDCFALPDVVVGPGETVHIAVAEGAGLEGVVATHATIGELHHSDGEISLYTSLALDDPEAMSFYFQWGSTPHDLTQTAVDAGLWVQGGYGPSSQDATRLFKDEKTGLWLFDEP